MRLDSLGCAEASFRRPARRSSGTEREDVVYISPKTIGGQELGIQSNQVVILAVIFVVLLPLAVIVCGTVIWLRRRHK